MRHEEGVQAGSVHKAFEGGQLGAAHRDRYRLPARGLPLPPLARNLEPQAELCAVASVDVNGRLADRRPLQALGWLPGHPIDVTGKHNEIAVTSRRGGRWKISRQGHLFLPSSVRRSCGIGSGDRLLILAYPDRSLLVAYTMGALELMVSRYVGEQEAA